MARRCSISQRYVDGGVHFLALDSGSRITSGKSYLHSASSVSEIGGIRDYFSLRKEVVMVMRGLLVGGSTGLL